MTATAKPTPGSPAAVLDTVVRSVTEGRYRYATLHLLWNRQRVLPDDMAQLVNAASAAPHLPLGLTGAQVIERAKPQLLPGWLSPHVDTEINRICARQPLSGSTPVHLVARLVAAVCIDVCAETLDAAHRAEQPAAGQPVADAPTRRLIHLTAPEMISLGEEERADTGPLLPPPPR